MISFLLRQFWPAFEPCLYAAYSVPIPFLVKVAMLLLLLMNEVFILSASEGSAHGVVFNELMVDPSPPVGWPEYEYVELYNYLDCDVDLTGWTLTCGKTVKTFPESTIHAHQYLLLIHRDAESMTPVYGTVLGIFTHLSTLANDGQTLVLQNESGEVVDALFFSPSWYGDTRKKAGGWSLERNTSFTAQSPATGYSDGNQWQASADPSGGTPGRINSRQIIPLENVFKLTLTKGYFTPNGDGQDEVCEIHYDLPDHDYRLTSFIFDRQGRKIRTLCQDEMVRWKGSLYWDGQNDGGQKVNENIYILYVQAYHESGKVYEKKETVVVKY